MSTLLPNYYIPDNVWINAHSPSNPTDSDMDVCEDTGPNCAAAGVVIKGKDGSNIDISLYDKVKVEDLKDTNQEECIKFKDPETGGKLESESCSSDKHVACYTTCGKRKHDSPGSVMLRLRIYLLNSTIAAYCGPL